MCAKSVAFSLLYRTDTAVGPETCAISIAGNFRDVRNVHGDHKRVHCNFHHSAATAHPHPLESPPEGRTASMTPEPDSTALAA